MSLAPCFHFGPPDFHLYIKFIGMVSTVCGGNVGPLHTCRGRTRECPRPLEEIHGFQINSPVATTKFFSTTRQSPFVSSGVLLPNSSHHRDYEPRHLFSHSITCNSAAINPPSKPQCPCRKCRRKFPFADATGPRTCAIAANGGKSGVT